MIVASGAEMVPSRPLSHFERLGYELETSTEALNEVLRKTEARLGAVNLGIAASVVIDSDPDETYLSYERFKDGAWKLVITYSTNFGDIKKEEPALSATRDIRVLAGQHLDRLINSILEIAQSRVDAVKKAVEIGEAAYERIAGEGESVYNAEATSGEPADTSASSDDEEIPF